MNAFARFLQYMKKTENLSEIDIGEITDINNIQIHRWITGVCRPNIENVEKVAESFGYHVEFVPNDQKLDVFEKAYEAGYQYGYQRAIKDMAKRLREMRWYGGDKQKKRAAGVPEHHAGRAESLQQGLQRADSGGQDGGSMGAGAAEGKDPGGSDSRV